MKKTTLITLLFTILFTTIAFSQKEEKAIERSVKIYVAFQYLPLGNLPIRNFDLPPISYNSTGIAFFRENENKERFIEIGSSYYYQAKRDLVTRLTSIGLGTPRIAITFPANSRAFNLGLRFERGRWVKRLCKGKWKFGFGGAVRGLVHLSDFVPIDTSSVFSEERIQSYLVLGFVPRIRYDLNSKFYVALSFPFEVVGFEVGGEALIRLGVGYNF